jgi:uncharacterized protein YbbC (DUF1343 family)/CubicO group peptidase (beta-lactamase class C family)
MKVILLLIAGLLPLTTSVAANAAMAPWDARCRARALPSASPQRMGFAADLRGDLQALLDDAVRRRLAPSAVLVVARKGKVVFRGAAGAAGATKIFDLASLTKVVATTPAIMQLVEEGKLRLDAPIGRYLPRLRGTSKATITTRQLLLHISGLHSGVWAGPRPKGPVVRLSDLSAKILPRIHRSRLRALPGGRYKYSDIGFILLGRIVEQLRGRSLAQVTRDRLFGPLGMCDTGFVPRGAWLARTVSPWPKGGNHGVVYDPLAARLAGVAGHAGLYGTADDLARYGQALLSGGFLAGKRVLGARTIQTMFTAAALPGGARRALGWRVAGAGLTPRSVGHTGYTGTSLWLDRRAQLVVVLLTNRTAVIPAGRVGALRARVNRVLAAALSRPVKRAVRSGLDRLVGDRFKQLAGARVGLITNHTAVDAKGRWIVDLLLAAPKVRLQAIFAPEHGLKAKLDRYLGDKVLRRRGRRVPVYSLFGDRRRPTDKTLRGVDTLVFDMQTVGVRYYTYLATMGWAMEEAARRKLRFVVLDRPNPLGGLAVQGPVSSATRRTSTNYHPIPVRHGMTIGELARLYNGERRIGAKLQVLRASGWRRSWRFDRWGQGRWRYPSPNIRSWRQALLYAAVGLLESTRLAVGRGTKSPFHWFGAPWIDGPKLARELARHKLPGVHIVPVSFTPRSSWYRGKRCHGVRLLLTNAARFRPPRAAVVFATTLLKLYPRAWPHKGLFRLFNHPPTTKAILAGESPERVWSRWTQGLARFRKTRRRYLLY